MLLKDLYPDSLDEWRSQKARFSPRTHGSFLSPIRQTTRMPAPSRKYVHGDPVRNIDWRAFARTDQLLVREQRENSSVSVLIHVDAQETMIWPDISVPPNIRMGLPQKIDVAWRMACHIAAGHGRMGDLVFICIWRDQKKREVFQVKSTRDLMERFHHGIGESENVAGALGVEETGSKIEKEHTMVYWIGDGLSAIEQTWQSLEKCRYGAFLQLLSSLETSVGWLSPTHSYVDQNPPRKEYLGEALLQGEVYQNKLAKWQSKCRLRCQSLGRDFGVFTEQTPVEAYLRFLENVGLATRSGPMVRS